MSVAFRTATRDDVDAIIALLQLATHASRNRARDLHDPLGCVASHVGCKHRL